MAVFLPLGSTDLFSSLLSFELLPCASPAEEVACVVCSTYFTFGRTQLSSCVGSNLFHLCQRVRRWLFFLSHMSLHRIECVFYLFFFFYLFFSSPSSSPFSLCFPEQSAIRKGKPHCTHPVQVIGYTSHLPIFPLAVHKKMSCSLCKGQFTVECDSSKDSP